MKTLTLGSYIHTGIKWTTIWSKNE